MLKRKHLVEVLKDAPGVKHILGGDGAALESYSIYASFEKTSVIFRSKCKTVCLNA